MRWRRRKDSFRRRLLFSGHLADDSLPFDHMKIAFATCAGIAEFTPDDQNLARVLVSLGHDVQPLIWNRDGSDSFDAIVIRSIWDYHKHFVEFLAWLND